MIYRPDQDVSGTVRAGIYLTSDPKLELGKGGDIVELDIENSLNVAPIEASDIDKVKNFWGSCPASLENFPDSMGSPVSGVWLVSKAIADVIEELEPGMHDLIELPRLWSEADLTQVDGAYFVLNVYQAVACIDQEKSKVYQGKVRSTGQTYLALESLTADTCFVIEKNCAGRHLWRDGPTRQTLMSQELHDRLVEVGCLGMSFTETTVV